MRAPRFLRFYLTALLCLAAAEAYAAPVQIRLVKAGTAELLPQGYSQAGDLPGGYVDRSDIFVDGQSLGKPSRQAGDRLQQADFTVDLPAGKHVLQPGAKEFMVTVDGRVAVTAPGLAAQGARLDVAMVPLALESWDLESEAAGQQAILQPVLETGNLRVFSRPWWYNPQYPCRACIYLPLGSIVTLEPQGAQVLVSDKGPVLQQDPSGSLRPAGRTLELGMTPFRFTVQRRSHQAGRGTSLNLQGNGMNMGQDSVYQWGAWSCDYKWLLPWAPQPFSVQVLQSPNGAGRVKSGTVLGTVAAHTRDLPYASLLVCRLSEMNDSAVLLYAALPRLKYTAGDQVVLSLVYQGDSGPGALADPEVGVYLRPESFSTVAEPEWRKLDLAQAGERWRLTLPADLITNRYRLRLCADEAGALRADSYLHRDFVIGVVNPTQVATVGLFLPAQRGAFVAGEEIEAQATVVARQALAGVVRLRLQGEHLDQRLGTTPARQFPPGRTAAGWVLPEALTRVLKPGTYRLTAELTDAKGQVAAASARVPFLIVSDVHESLYPAHTDCYGNGWLGAWLNADTDYLSSNAGMEQGAYRVFGLGLRFLRFDGWYQTLNTGAPAAQEAETQTSGAISRPVLPDDPDLPPVEGTMVPKWFWRSFDYALRYQATLMPSLMPGDGPRIETEIPDLLAQQRRQVRLAVQYLRRYPNYAGISYSHWSGPSYTGTVGGTTNPPPEEVVKATRQAVWDDFCKRYGFKGDTPTSWYGIGVPAGGGAVPQNRDLWEKWVRFCGDLLPRVHADWGKAAQQVWPLLINTDSRGAPGFWAGPRQAYDAAPHGNPLASTAGLNYIEGETNDDWGIEPYSLSLQGSLFGFGWELNKPVCVSGWAHYGMAQTEYLRFALETLATGAIPSLYGASLAPVFDASTSHEWIHQNWGRRQGAQRVMQTLSAYGDWTRAFQGDRPVGVLASWTQCAITEARTGYAQPTRHGAAIYQVFCTCLLAGHTPTFIYEDLVAQDPHALDGLKVLILSDITGPLPDKIVQALQAFMARGGTILADATCNRSLPATARLSFDFLDFWNYGNSIMGKEMNSSEYTSCYWMRMRQFALDKREALNSYLDKADPPLVSSDLPDVLLTAAHAGNALLIFASNQTPLPYRFVTDMPRPFFYLHHGWNAPVKARVTIPGGKGYVYDAFALKELPLENGAFTADMTQMSGRLFVVLPQRIGSLQVLGASSPGSLVVQASALGEDGKPLATPVPLEITVTDAAGAARYHLFRTSGRAESLPVAVNDPAGKWAVQVRELLSGKAVQGTIGVVPASWPAGEVGAKGLRGEAVTVDRAAVTGFLKSERGITVALDRRQSALRPLADGLVQALGKQARVAWTDELVEGTNKKLLWTDAPLPPASRVRGPLILLGSPTDNSLLAELCDSGVLLRQASSDYPGPNGYVLAHIWSAFSGDDACLAVMADTEAGLHAAVGQIKALLGGAALTGYDPVPTLKRAHERILPPLFTGCLKASSGLPASAPAAAPALKPLTTQPVPAEGLPYNAVGDPVSCLAATADGQTLLVGTDGYFRNLLRVDAASGRATGAQVGQRFTHQVATTPDGQFTVVATTEPCLVTVLDAKGKTLWTAKPPFDWGSDPRWLRDEPDLFALAPAGDRVVVREPEQKLVCHETATGKVLWEYPYASADPRVWRDAFRLRFSGDGTRLAASVMSYLSDDKAAKALSETPTEALPADLKPLDEAARHRVVLLEAAAGKLLWERSERTMPQPESAPRGTPFFDPLVPRANLDTRRLVYLPRVVGFDLAVSRTGDSVVASDEFGDVVVYPAIGEPQRAFAAPVVLPAVPWYLRLSPDGQRMALFCSQYAGQWETRAFLLDLGRRTVTPLGGVEPVSDIAWACNGQSVAVARWDGSVSWYTPEGRPTERLALPSGVGCVLLALPSGWLAGTSHGHLLRLEVPGKVSSDLDLNPLTIPAEVKPAPAQRTLPAAQPTGVVWGGEELSRQVTQGQAATKPWEALSSAYVGLPVMLLDGGGALKVTFPWEDRFVLRLGLVAGREFGPVEATLDGKPLAAWAVGALGEAHPAGEWASPSVPATAGEHTLALQAGEGRKIGLEYLALEGQGPHVRDWIALGPFDSKSEKKLYEPGYQESARTGLDQPLPAEADLFAGKLDLAAQYPGKGGKQVGWLHGEALSKCVGAASGWLDLWSAFASPGAESAGMVSTQVYSPQARTEAAWLLWNQGLRLFVGGKEVLSSRLANPPGGGGAEKRVDLPLQQGWNRLVAKVDLGAVWWQEYGLSLRLADYEGLKVQAVGT